MHASSSLYINGHPFGIVRYDGVKEYVDHWHISGQSRRRAAVVDFVASCCASHAVRDVSLCIAFLFGLGIIERDIHCADQPPDRRSDTTYYYSQPKQKRDAQGHITYRMRGTAGGDKINYRGPASALTADMPVVNFLLHSVISDNTAKTAHLLTAHSSRLEAAACSSSQRSSMQHTSMHILAYAATCIRFITTQISELN